MFSKLRNKLWIYLNAKVVKAVPRKAIVKVAFDSNTYHPPMQNHKCHHNSAWHLKHNTDVIAVGSGFYVDTDTSNNPIAHFICLDMWGNWFDPTLPTAYIQNNDFYLMDIYTTTEQFHQGNCDDILMENKRKLFKHLPWFIRKINNIHIF